MRCLFVVFSLVIFAGCASSKQATTSVSETPEFIYHTVSEKGQTLAGISHRYTGSAANWRTILEYNPDLNVYRLQIGDKIKIPASLIKSAQESDQKNARPAAKTSEYRPQPSSSAPVGSGLGAVSKSEESEVSPGTSQQQKVDSEGELIAEGRFGAPGTEVNAEQPQDSEAAGKIYGRPSPEELERKRQRDRLLDEILEDM